MTSKFLFKGSVVLVHDKHDHVIPVESDLLVEGNKITKIEKAIKINTFVSVIDCTNKILSPGFVDTHYHLWQTQLKGRYGNESLLDYIYNGSIMSYNFVPKDVFWGQLGGAVEAIDSGTTTVVDFSHVLYSPGHGKISQANSLRLEPQQISKAVLADVNNKAKATSALSATILSGLRSVFCYCPTTVVKRFNPKLELDMNLLPGTHSLVDLLDLYGILRPDLLIVHATQATHDDVVKLVNANAHISSTPDTELQMALGELVCFCADLQAISSLGVDCYTNNSTSTRNQRLIEAGKFPDSIFPTVEEVYNLGTIKGARAIRQEADIRSLAVRKKADIVIFDATSPALICAAQQDPVCAIVLHASSRDIDYVMIDGHVRKENGTILPVIIEEEISPDERGTV